MTFQASSGKRSCPAKSVWSAGSYAWPCLLKEDRYRCPRSQLRADSAEFECLGCLWYTKARRQSVGLWKVRRRLSCLTFHASPHRPLCRLARALSWVPVQLFFSLLPFSFSCQRWLVPSRGGVVPHRRPLLVHHLRKQSPLRQLQRPTLLHLWGPLRRLPFCNWRSVGLLSFLSFLPFSPLA
jgi:hypothetical protein